MDKIISKKINIVLMATAVLFFIFAYNVVFAEDDGSYGGDSFGSVVPSGMDSVAPIDYSGSVYPAGSGSVVPGGTEFVTPLVFNSSAETSNLNSENPSSMNSVAPGSMDSVAPGGMEAVTPLVFTSSAGTPSNLDSVSPGSMGSVAPDTFNSVTPLTFNPVTPDTFGSVAPGDMGSVAPDTFNSFVPEIFTPVAAMAFTPSEYSYSYGTPGYYEGYSNVPLIGSNFSPSVSGVNVPPLSFTPGLSGPFNSPPEFIPGSFSPFGSSPAFTPGSYTEFNSPSAFSQGYSSVFNTPNFFSSGYSTVPITYAAGGTPVALAAVPATGITDDPRIIFFLIAILGLGALIAYRVYKFFIKKNLFGLASSKIKLSADGVYVFAEAMNNHFEFLSQIQWDDPIREKLVGEMDNLKNIIGSGAFVSELFENQAKIVRTLWDEVASDGGKAGKLKESLFELELIIRGQKEKQLGKNLKAVIA